MKNEDVVTRWLQPLAELAPAGYAIALHVGFQTPRYLFQTYPLDWRDAYSREGMVMRDPTVAWAFGNLGRIAWADLPGAATSDVMARGAEYGLRHGLTVAVSREGTRSMASFARPDRPFTDEEEEEIEQALSDLHDATADELELDDSQRERLRRLSIAFTHS